MMKANVGGIDKVLRIVVGVLLLALVLLIDGPAKWWGLFGLVPLATGLFGFCPLYAVFGFSTCQLEKKGAA
jgi:sulfite exporter TauE/SafE